MTLEAFAAQETGFAEMDLNSIRAATALYNRIPAVSGEIQDGILSLASEVAKYNSRPKEPSQVAVPERRSVPESIQDFLGKWRLSVLSRNNEILTTCYAL